MSAERTRNRRILGKLSKANRFRLMLGQPLIKGDGPELMSVTEQGIYLEKLRKQDDERARRREKDS